MQSAPGSPPVLVILRGNSGSGKSTLARAVQRSLPEEKVAVIGQDHVRRDLLWEREEGQHDTVSLITAMAEHCLGREHHTVVEGIFGSEHYRGMVEHLLGAHPGPSLVYYLDVGLAETLRRHGQRSFAAEVPDAEVASWYREHDRLDVPGETVLGKDLDAAAMLAQVLTDLASVRSGSRSAG